MTYSAKVIAGGKIVIPAELRRALGVKEGDRLVIEEDGKGGLTVKTYAQVVREVQDKYRHLVPEGVSLVDDLIADRRREFEKEEQEMREALERRDGGGS